MLVLQCAVRLPPRFMPFPLPSNEADRLQALAEYHILDSAPEQAFDDLTSLAAQICGCPIALVTCVAESRQWFKSRVGLDVSETPRDQSFCAHAIMKPSDLLIVPDAMLDTRFAANPLVLEKPNIRFYAGAPLLAQSGQALGSLCVIDRVPRQLADEQLAALRMLGRQVSYLLELRRVSQELAMLLSRTGQSQS